jgi:hypothetical protein
MALATKCGMGGRHRMSVRRRGGGDAFESDRVSLFQVLAMPSRKALVLYLAIFALVASVAGATYRTARWAYSVLGCIPYTEPGAFLAHCLEPHYGDYEHAAYYYGLQPQAIENLKKAKVLILGNSRTQFAFSTDVMRQYFRERSIPYYVFAFGYDEGVDFPRMLIEKYSLRPDVLLIVADPFFGNGLSEPARAIVGGSFWGRISAFEDAVRKKIFNALLLTLCHQRNALCRSDRPTIYRYEQDGSWIWQNIFWPPEAGQLALLPPDRVPRLRVEDYDITNAKRLFDAAGVRKDCIALTFVPNNFTNAEPYAAEISQILGVNVVLPWGTGWMTLDHSHMTWSSARRWSAAFLQGANSLITRCVAQGSAPGKN